MPSAACRRGEHEDRGHGVISGGDQCQDLDLDRVDCEQGGASEGRPGAREAPQEGVEGRDCAEMPHEAVLV